MSQEGITIVLSILGAIVTWTGTVVALVLWLTGKFRDLEKSFYREMDLHRREDNTLFSDHGNRLQRLELKEFGFTQNP